MSKIISLLGQDLRLLLRNAIFWVITASLVLIVITINWLIPAEANLTDSNLIVYGLQLADGRAQVAESPAAVYEQVRSQGAVGLINHDGQLTVVHGRLSQQAIAALVAQVTPPPADLPEVQTQTLRQTQQVGQNLRLMPVMISFEAVVLGFLMAAILLLGEKQEGTLRAYRVSPGGAINYIVSKSLLFAFVGTLYALLMTFATVGFSFALGQFVLLTVLGSLLYTLLGLCLAVFFDDISGWFFIATLILALNMLPMISFAAPAFSPAWMQAIPSYGGLFAYEEILFPTGKALTGVYLTLGVEVLVAFGLCSLLVKRKLLAAD